MEVYDLIEKLFSSFAEPLLRHTHTQTVLAAVKNYCIQMLTDLAELPKLCAP